MISSVGGNYSSMVQSSIRRPRENPFKKLDANSDGSLNISELGKMAKQISKISGKSVNADEIMSKLDSDNSGTLSEAEFKAKGPPPPPGQMNGIGLKASLQIQQGDGMQGIGGTQKPNGNGAPKGPPPSGNGGGQMDSLLESLSSEDSSDSSTDPLDTNGDGIVDSSELMAGFGKQVQQYVNQMSNGLNQNLGSTSMFSLSA